MTDSTVNGAPATNGGAVYMTGGSMTLTDSTVNGAQVTSAGGAIYIDKGSVTMTGGKLVGANAANGAAVHMKANSTNGASFTMNSGIIDASNAATSSCGTAVNIDGYNGQTKFTMHDGQIIGGTATSVGGGAVSVQDTNGDGKKGIFEMNGGTISGGISNSATEGHGGGNVRVTIGGKFDMNGGVITGGTAGNDCGGVVVTGGKNAVTIGGSAKIYGNNGCDLFLNSSYTITVKEDWEGNGDTPMVVKTADAVGDSGLTIANASGTLTAAHAAGFTGADNYDAALVDNTIKLVYPTYCICGANEGEEHIGDCDGKVLTWTAWKNTDSLPLESGNYYLVNDVQLTKRHNLNDNAANITEDVVLNIDLNGHTVTGVQAHSSGARNFVLLSSMSVNINMTITDSSPEHDGLIRSHPQRTESANQGVLFFLFKNSGSKTATLNLYRVELDASNDTGTTGVAIHVDAPNVLNMYGTTVKGGTATNNTQGGGAIYSGGTVKIANGSVIHGGSATNGGAIYSSGKLTLTESTVHGGTAALPANGDTNTTGQGAAIYSTGTLTMTDSTIHGGQAYRGGALSIAGGTATMEGGIIYGGIVEKSSGAVHLRALSTSGASFTMKASAKGEPVIDASGKIMEGFACAVNVDGVNGSSSFTMECGTIYGGTTTGTTGGGAVIVQDTSNHGRGIFLMNGGLITGGVAENAEGYGGGNVRISTGGTFRMYGGTITGGRDLGNCNAGGIKVESAANELTIGGSAKVYGNAGSDVYLNGDKHISIADGWEGNGVDEDGNNNKMVIVYMGTEQKVVARDSAITDDNSWNSQASTWISYLDDGVGLVVNSDGIYTPRIDESLLETRCICGANEGEDHIGDCDGSELLTWRPWYSVDSLPTTTGNYYLACDEDVLKLTQTCAFNTNSVPAGSAEVVINIDLKGREVNVATGGRGVTFNTNVNAPVTMTITDSSVGHTGKFTRTGNAYTAQGVLFFQYNSNPADPNYSTVNIYRAKLDASGISAPYGTCVRVDQGNTMNLYGATVLGGTATGINENGNATGIGGGAISSSGTVNVVGSTISGGTSNLAGGGAIYTDGNLSLKDTSVSGGNADKGGAVYVNGGTFSVGGKVVINSGKSLDGTAASNVYLARGSCITLSESLTEDASIGVIVPAGEGRFTNWANAEASKACFFEDSDAAMQIGVNEGHGLYFKGAETYRVGYGEADITPPEVMLSTLHLSGYGTNKTPTAIDTYRLMAQCVAVTDAQGDTVLLISTDLNYIESWSKDVRVKISEATGVPYDNIMIAADHVHSAPYVDQEGGTTKIDIGDGVVKSYMDIVKEGLVQAAEAAMADRGIISTVETAANEGVNDAGSKVFNGVRNYKASLWWNNDWRNGTEDTKIGYLGIYTPNHQSYASPNLKENWLNLISYVAKEIRKVAESEVDDELQLVKYTYGDGKTLILANFQMHPHLASGGQGQLITSDVVGVFRQKLRTLTGANVIYFSGAGGNIDPTSSEYGAQNYSASEYVKFGEDLAAIANSLTYRSTQGGSQDVEVVISSLQAAPYVDTDFTKADGSTVSLADRLARAEVIYAEYQQCVKNGTGYTRNESDSLNYGIYSEFHAKWMLQRANGNTGSNTLTLGAYALGDIAFVGAPYEMYDTNGMEIKDQIRYSVVADPDGGYMYDYSGAVENLLPNGFDVTFIATQANGSKTYIPSALGYANGGYSVDTATVAEGTGEALADAFLDMLNQLRPAD